MDSPGCNREYGLGLLAGREAGELACSNPTGGVLADAVVGALEIDEGLFWKRDVVTTGPGTHLRYKYLSERATFLVLEIAP